LSGARYRAGFGHFRPRLPYNIRIPRAQEVLGRPVDAKIHTAEHHASAVFYLGAPITEIPPALLAAEPVTGRPRTVVFHVAAAYPTKQWAAERFRAVAEFVKEKHGLEPLILVGPGEGPLLESFTGFRCYEGLSLEKLKSVLAGARLFVGNDSGPAHVAAAFGVPSIVIFGSSDSAIWGPWRTEHEIVETAWDCKPCPGDRCYAFDQPRCILSVEILQVQAAIDRLLSRTAPVPNPARARDE
jgi:ADP-heptose:LPS heptosyltransferase